MVNWVGIENVTPKLPPIWLSRQNEMDQWKPLRKVDCQKLNNKANSKTVKRKPVLIENNRATADPELGVIRYNFTRRRQKELTSATWFLKDDYDRDNNPILIPVEEKDMLLVEDLYQRAIHEASLMGNGLERLLKDKVSLDENYDLIMQRHGGDKYSFRKVPKGWFGKSWDLQRGYGNYTVEGEVEEEMLGPVEHVIFVIHGVGEAQRSGRGGISAENSLENVVAKMRLRMQKQQVDEWVRKCDAAISQELPTPPPPNRVELIPIFWYDRLQSSSNSLMTSLKATTLNTIPGLREIANDLMFEVLTYMSPPFCHAVLECVTEQIIEIHSLFKKIHSGYAGQFSLMGHSLGSVICWDLITILKDRQSNNNNPSEFGVTITPEQHSADMLFRQLSRDGESGSDDNGVLGSWGPSLPRPIERHIPFVPDLTIFFGSPLGLFLTLRGVHPVFDALRDADTRYEEKPKPCPFTLPSGSIHNIFHPNDPVAYRIEPLLLAQGTEDIPPPIYLTREDKGLRLHVQAMHLGDNIRKSITQTSKSISSFVDNNITDPVQRLFGKEPPERPEEEEEEPLRFPLAGGSGRLDFQLQPPVIDNKYLAVAAAHASYFTDTDILDYLIDLTRDRRPVRSVIDESAAAEAAQTAMTDVNEQRNDHIMDTANNYNNNNTEDNAVIIAI